VTCPLSSYRSVVFPTLVGVVRAAYGDNCKGDISLPHASGGGPRCDRLRHRACDRLPHASGGGPEGDRARWGGSNRLPHASGGGPRVLGQRQRCFAGLPHASGGGPPIQHLPYCPWPVVFPTLVGVVRPLKQHFISDQSVFPTLVGVVRVLPKKRLLEKPVFPTLVGVVREDKLALGTLVVRLPHASGGGPGGKEPPHS